ncbi:cysteine hydrolase family protein [Chengkuizengella axinellae]|uniref:Cysteine hydrolase family protein n=1 Tax=Chengkuizengella axinellae TaxID=3064388 RepID=A0ABT9IU14_9BACL|nr:cysteine hydrolase family protein [Chengkuizengella sp. 2205SS18-9]MDP5272839.1 cysteine hydrolase family protein [Chengkuizengella sp. 2205SS18-9]
MDNKTALLIIDVQVIMFTYGGGKLHNGEKVLHNIKELLKKARSSNTTVVFIQHTEAPNLIEGKEGWPIHPELGPFDNEVVIQKNYVDSFYKTALHEKLQEHGIENLVIVGMQTDFCVDTTCRRAFSMGYKSVLVEDGHSTFDTEVLKAEQIIAHHNNTLGGRFVELKSTNEIEF